MRARDAFILALVIGMGINLAFAQVTPSKELLFSFFADGEVWQSGLRLSEHLNTRFTFTNVSPNATSVTIQFFSQNGNMLDFRIADPVQGVLLSNPFNLPSRASVEIGPVKGINLMVGWVRVTSTEPITALESIVRRTLFSFGGPAELGPPEAAVALPPSLPTKNFSVDVVDDFEWSAGIAIAVPANAASAVVDGVLTLLDLSGEVVTQRSISIPRGTQLARTAAEFFPELLSRRHGTISAQFNADVIVTSLKFAKRDPRLPPEDRGSRPYSFNLVSDRAIYVGPIS